jgi:hypothetical protein
MLVDSPPLNAPRSASPTRACAQPSATFQCLRQPLRLHLIEHRILLLVSCVVPEQPLLEGGPRAAEAVGTIAVAQMGSEGSMAFALSHAS